MPRKLDEMEVAVVLQLIREGLSDAEIAKRVGVSRQAINDIRNNRTHKGAVR